MGGWVWKSRIYREQEYPQGFGLIEDYCTSKNRRYMFYNIKAFLTKIFC